MGARNSGPTPWAAPSLPGTMPAGPACRALFGSLLAAIRQNLPGTLADDDIEYLHDLRVAVRRTRSGIRWFGGVYEPERLARFATGFRWLQRASGPARDLDVQLADLPGDDATTDLEPLRELLRLERQAAHWMLRRALTSARFTDLLRDWDGFLHRPAPGPEVAHPVVEVAGDRIRRAYRRLVKQGRRVSPDTAAEVLHETRKRGKELRYLLEFFAPAYPGKPMKRLIVELKALQQNLGGFQDHQVQAAHLREWGEELSLAGCDPATITAVAELIVHHDSSSAAARAEFADRFAAFDGARNRRRFEDLFGGTG